MNLSNKLTKSLFGAVLAFAFAFSVSASTVCTCTSGSMTIELTDDGFKMSCSDGGRVRCVIS